MFLKFSIAPNKANLLAPKTIHLVRTPHVIPAGGQPKIIG